MRALPPSTEKGLPGQELDVGGGGRDRDEGGRADLQDLNWDPVCGGVLGFFSLSANYSTRVLPLVSLKKKKKKTPSFSCTRGCWNLETRSVPLPGPQGQGRQGEVWKVPPYPPTMRA